jgi:hypothetical protein
MSEHAPAQPAPAPAPGPPGDFGTAGTAVARLRMPARAELVAEAVDRLDGAGLRSQICRIDRATLRDLGLRLVDRQTTVADAHRWLNAELGAPGIAPGDAPGDAAGGDAEVVDDNAVYRFAEHFRGLYAQVRAEHARRLARLTVADASDGHVGRMRGLATQRLVDLVTEKLVDTDDLEELSNAEVRATLATLEGLTNAEFRQAELALKREEAQRRAEKLEQEVERLRQEIELKKTRIEDRVKRLGERIEELEGRARRGAAIDPGVFETIRNELLGVDA